MNSFWEKVLFVFIGIKQKPSSIGSNRRRVQSRLTLYAAIMMVLSAWVETSKGVCDHINGYDRFVLWFLVLFAAYFFLNIVLRAPFRNSKQLPMNPQRLLLDTVISSALIIALFANSYWIYGFEYNQSIHDGTRLDALYFSAVTFSTLGFGDFAPSDGMSQVFAAVQALLGNIHLGFVVGSTFAAMQAR